MKKILRMLMVMAIAILFTSSSLDTRWSMVEEVKAEIKKQNIKHPEIVLRQAIWESGWFECTGCSWDHKNMFGFRNKIWITPTNPKGYKEWDNWRESVRYYKRWQDRKYAGGNYYKFLINRGYSESDDYIINLKSIKLEAYE